MSWQMRAARQLELVAISGTLPLLERWLRLSTRALDLQWWLRWRRLGLAYRGRSEDTFIVSYPKSGATWMQMLLYQLLTDGQIRFQHIDEFSPFLEMDLPRLGIRALDVISAMPHPRVIKSHLDYALVPKGPGRYIYVARNGLDVAVSWYHQEYRSTSWPKRPFPAVLEAVLRGGAGSGSWSSHVRDWVRNSAGLNTLFVAYEDLIRDFPGQARRVADFCGVTLDASQWQRVCANCTFDFMRQHEEKFDPWSPRWKVEEQDAHFVRKGQVGGWSDLVDAVMLARFREHCAAAFADLPVPAVTRAEDAVPKPQQTANGHSYRPSP